MFTVKSDGNWLYNPALGFYLINPVLTLEDSCAGSFEFTMPPDHAEYEHITVMTSKVIVYRDGMEIWRGRPLNTDTDFYKQKKVFCEGELAILNDTIQPPAEYHNRSVRQWLTSVLNIHNANVSDDKKFYVGAVTVEDNLYRYTNYENTLEAINDKLVSRLGGHLRVRWSGGKRYLDYLKDYPKTSDQIIRFGQNLVDYSNNFDQSDIATVIIPLGAKLDESPIEALDAYLDVRSVNNGSIYVINPTAVANFGWICKIVRWDDVTIASNLLTKARKYLTDFQYDTMCLTVKAVDFHLVDNGIPALDLLDEVRVVSKPHGLDRLFPVTKMTIPLENPGNTDITMGTVVQQSLTNRNSAAIQALKDAIEAIPTESSILEQAKENATQLIVSGALGSHVVVKPDEIYIMDTSDTATARKVWRWNVNGLGYSSNGINGPYGLAMTMDGKIVADYVTAGTMLADRIKGGTLSLGGSSNTNGLIKMYDSTKTLIGQWDKDGLTLSKGKIKGNQVEIDGEITARDFRATGSFNADVDWYAYIKIPHTLNANSGFTRMWCGGFEYNNIRAGNPGVVIIGEQMKNSNQGVIGERAVLVSNSRYTDSSTEYAHLRKAGLEIVRLGNPAGTYYYEDGAQVKYLNCNNNLQVGGNMNVSGTKSRLVDTDDYGTRLLYCYETPSPLFGDVGEGTISEDGKCYVFIDSIYAKTVSLDQYQVFLQKYGAGDAYVSERTPGYFIVEGTPGLSFGWELKAKQTDFDQLRLEKYMDTNVPGSTDYGSLAMEHINHLTEERTSA